MTAPAFCFRSDSRIKSGDRHEQEIRFTTDKRRHGDFRRRRGRRRSRPVRRDAVHECGTQHEGQSGDDQGFGKGCNGLDERDFVYGDPRPDAPELAYRGPHAVGVRTLQVVNPDQLDILNYSADNTDPRYDRPLTLEVWYPADLAPGDRELTTYSDVLGSGPGNPLRPITPFEFTGRAARGASRRHGRRPLSAGHRLARLSGLAGADDPSDREPGVEGLCGGLDRPHRIDPWRQGRLRLVGLRQHLAQPDPGYPFRAQHGGRGGRIRARRDSSPGWSTRSGPR